MAVRRNAVRFWLSAALVAGGWAVACSLFFPYEALGLQTGAERARVWLLTLWTSGVMAICFGIAGILGYSAPLGFKEIADSGSLTQALEARRRSKRIQGSFYTNFAGWLIVTGFLLIAIYFLVWGFVYG